MAREICISADEIQRAEQLRDRAITVAEYRRAQGGIRRTHKPEPMPADIERAVDGIVAASRRELAQQRAGS